MQFFCYLLCFGLGHWFITDQILFAFPIKTLRGSARRRIIFHDIQGILPNAAEAESQGSEIVLIPARVLVKSAAGMAKLKRNTLQAGEPIRSRVRRQVATSARGEEPIDSVGGSEYFQALARQLTSSADSEHGALVEFGRVRFWKRLLTHRDVFRLPIVRELLPDAWTKRRLAMRCDLARPIDTHFNRLPRRRLS